MGPQGVQLAGRAARQAATQAPASVGPLDVPLDELLLDELLVDELLLEELVVVPLLVVLPLEVVVPVVPPLPRGAAAARRTPARGRAREVPPLEVVVPVALLSSPAVAPLASSPPELCPTPPSPGVFGASPGSAAQAAPTLGRANEGPHDKEPCSDGSSEWAHASDL